ncbi:unnamed protein product [Psylliodes chrysocephalus]|uniref:Uncharacterized protein n=1 Tax=Psylliodes chrysocephalus TaxID=3402493 RepID=A0A9P0GCH3_9CUCU|nr:unnamed protein product [Psylliodes chrysocephala]
MIYRSNTYINTIISCKYHDLANFFCSKNKKQRRKQILLNYNL